MNEKNYIHLCLCLSKATNATIRLYKGTECRYYHTVYPLDPDPASLLLSKLLDPAHEAGIITTPLYQFYGFLSINDDYRIIIGPTRIQNDESWLIEEQLFLLGISPEKKEDYIRSLFCMPLITINRLSWTISFLKTSIQQHPFFTEQLHVDITSESYLEQRHKLQTEQAAVLSEVTATESEHSKVQHSLDFEKLLLSYVKNGNPEKLEELFSSRPNIHLGAMADNALRQIKNSCIVAATNASRTAIDCGMDCPKAFLISDIYIQEAERMSDIDSLLKLRNDIFIEYAKRVREIRYRIDSSNESNETKIFSACADYVSKNIYHPIRVDELAKTLGYSRTYLCNQFRKQTNLTLTQYILQERILEAQRLLELTDKNLIEISTLLCFSSQSHFQTVFKKITGETPLSYRTRNKKS